MTNYGRRMATGLALAALTLPWSSRARMPPAPRNLTA